MMMRAHPSRSITTAILAGGAATRLGGRDKGLALLRGRPLIAWALEALEPGQARLIVANRNLDEYARFAPTIHDERNDVFAGPLAGIAAALAACTTAWLYTVPVDCVRPHPEIFQRLWEELLKNPADVVVAHDGTRRQPLFAFYRSSLAGSAARGVAEGMGVTRWQYSLVASEVVLTGLEDAWSNLNTTEDFALMSERMIDDD